MICVKTFTEKSSKDFDNFQDWISFVNSNAKHCKEKSKVFDWRGKVEDVTRLPSEHPYWKYMVEYVDGKKKLKRVKELLENLKECPDDFSKGSMNGSMCNIAASHLMGTPHTKKDAMEKVKHWINIGTLNIFMYAKNYKG